ncbi:MAG: hypothetical protein QM813_22270 [Verrucomicrobiota bacterium]
MTTQQAKQILLAYRPWANDAQDQEMTEALALCRADAELGQWFEKHCAAQAILRVKLQGIKPPEGLLQQIMSERHVHVASRQRARQRLVVACAFVAIVISGWFIWKSIQPVLREDLSFDGYRNRMARTALRAYGMDVETNDVTILQAHLAANQAPVDYTMSEALRQTPAVGCGVLRWQSKPVAMLCFRTGQPLPVGMKSDLILFVARQADVQGSTELAETKFRKVSEWFTASWTAGDKVYLLAACDEAELRKRL